MTPKPRIITNSTLLTKPPCGSGERGRVHFVTMPGSRNYIAWKVLHASPKGICTLRIGTGPDEDKFHVLRPVDGDHFKNGSFPCGREEMPVEGRIFKFPWDYTCDSCVIQWEWQTELGQVHMCSDISIIGSGSKSSYLIFQLKNVSANAKTMASVPMESANAGKTTRVLSVSTKKMIILIFCGTFLCSSL